MSVGPKAASRARLLVPVKSGEKAPKNVVVIYDGERHLLDVNGYGFTLCGKASREQTKRAKNADAPVCACCKRARAVRDREVRDASEVAYWWTAGDGL